MEELQVVEIEKVNLNIYEKLLKARIMFQKKNLKPKGYNKYSDFYYFELDDILPVITEICFNLGVICLVSFGNELAQLRFKDLKNDEEIVFTSPMSTAKLKACHEVQNLGAVETYIKRYLYMHCFEIAESDQMDGATTEQPPRQPQGQYQGQGQGYQAPRQPQGQYQGQGYQAPPPQQQGQYYR